MTNNVASLVRPKAVIRTFMPIGKFQAHLQLAEQRLPLRCRPARQTGEWTAADPAPLLCQLLLRHRVALAAGLQKDLAAADARAQGPSLAERCSAAETARCPTLQLVPAPGAAGLPAAEAAVQQQTAARVTLPAVDVSAAAPAIR